ncbi:Gibberellin 2-beta-dioxygenase [Capsicum annuum]|nr:Gibberellin 2-beta-dioxygenase [Capsicum annuum]
MVVITTPSIDHFPIVNNSFIDPSLFNDVPIIDLSKPDSMNLIVKACEEFGFFKVINHDVPMEFISKLESEAVKFFSSPLSEKLKAGPADPDPFGYGNKKIGQNGDIGWVEYILVSTNSEFNYQKFASVLGVNPDNIRAAVNDYVTEVKKMACEVLEMLAEGLKIHQMNVFSKLLMDEESDSIFRTHNTSGLQILLKNGHWISVPPDPNSFFINVGDSLQVMTNGRFKSAKHRVLTNSVKSRLSMIYFGGPPLSAKIAPLPSLMEGKDSLYKEFTWFEYKKSAYKTRLSDNRLALFEKSL